MLSKTSYLPFVSRTMVNVPSPFELMAYPGEGSNATPSDWAPIAGDARTLPASGSETAITRLLQTEKRRRFLTSIAIPEGSSQGFKEYRFVIMAFAASI